MHPERKSVAVHHGLAAAAPFGIVLAKLPVSVRQVLENQAGPAEFKAMLGTRRILDNKAPISRSSIVDLKLVEIGGPQYAIEIDLVTDPLAVPLVLDEVPDFVVSEGHATGRCLGLDQAAFSVEFKQVLFS